MKQLGIHVHIRFYMSSRKCSTERHKEAFIVFFEQEETEEDEKLAEALNISAFEVCAFVTHKTAAVILFTWPRVRISLRAIVCP